jgi:uncharacterized membrane protein
MEQTQKIPLTEDQDKEQNKDVAAFSYTLLFSPLLLVTRKDSKFILFHARQAFVLFLFFVVFWAIGGFFRYMNIFVVVASAVGFLRSMAGEYYTMPIVSDFVKNGFSPTMLWEKIKSGIGYFERILSGLFSKTTEQNSSPLFSSKNNEDFEKRLGEIEGLFFVEKYFHKEIFEKMSPLLQKKCSEFSSALLMRYQDVFTKEAKDFSQYSGSFGKIYLGGYTEDEFYLGFSKKSFPNANPDFFLGDFGVIRVQNETNIDIL